MAWSEALQANKERLLLALISQCKREVEQRKKFGRKGVDRQTDPCRDLGICEEDLDDIQINAAAQCGLRPPLQEEPLVIPWHGPGPKLTLDDLAGWLAANCRPVAS